MTCELTIWTDNEVPSTKRYMFTADAIGDGDNALINLGCDRYRLVLDDGSASIIRKRKYSFVSTSENPWTVVTL